MPKRFICIRELLILAVAEYTSDADLASDPAALDVEPEIESAMTAAGFFRGNRVGAWCVSREIGNAPTRVEVDLMVWYLKPLEAVVPAQRD